MTPTRQGHIRFALAPYAVTALVLFVGACGSGDKPKAESTTTSPTTAAAVAADPNDSAYCKTARQWTVHEIAGGGDFFAGDPVALKEYWGEYLEFIAKATRQAPTEIRAAWPIGHDFLVNKFTPLLEKYGYDSEKIKAEGSPAEIAIGKHIEEGPNPQEQAAQDAVHEYEGRVCQTAQPPAAGVSFAGAKVNHAYCDAVKAGDDLAGHVNDKKWSIDAVRSFVTSDALAANLDKVAANAPAEIKDDVLADVDWQRNQQADVLEKFGYDVRKLLLEGTAEDRAIFQRSDPADAEHYARTVAYEQQLCGA